jgi:hypothetical protein
MMRLPGTRPSFLLFVHSSAWKRGNSRKTISSCVASSSAALYVAERSKRDVLVRRPNDSFPSRSDLPVLSGSSPQVCDGDQGGYIEQVPRVRIG